VARPGSNPGPPKLGVEENPDHLGRGFLLVLPITGATFASSAASSHPATRQPWRRPENLRWPMSLPRMRTELAVLPHCPTRQDDRTSPQPGSSASEPGVPAGVLFGTGSSWSGHTISASTRFSYGQTGVDRETRRRPRQLQMRRAPSPPTAIRQQPADLIGTAIYRQEQPGVYEGRDEVALRQPLCLKTYSALSRGKVTGQSR
jgi:hypothetical protein